MRATGLVTSTPIQISGRSPLWGGFAAYADAVGNNSAKAINAFFVNFDAKGP